VAASIFTSASTRCARPRNTWRNTKSKCGYDDTWLNKVNWSADGLYGDRPGTGTGKVLMVAWMNREALRLTVQNARRVLVAFTQEAVAQGEESGHVQKVRKILLDCDEDVILLEVEQVAASPATPAATTASSRNWRYASERNRTRAQEPDEIYKTREMKEY